MISFWKPVLFISILSFSVGLLIYLTGINDASNSDWIGFWGSFSGGVLGTVGVIYVAYLQNKEQRRQNEKQIQSQINSMYKMEQYNRNRLKVTTFIEKLEKHNSDVDNYLRTVKNLGEIASQLYRDILFYVRITEKSDRIFTNEEINFVLNRMENLKNESSNLIDDYNKLSSQEYLLLKMDIIDQSPLNKTIHVTKYAARAKSVTNLISMLLQDIDNGISYKDLKNHSDTIEQLLGDSMLEILIQEKDDDDDKYLVEKHFEALYNLENVLIESNDNTIENIVKHLNYLDEY